MRRREKSLNLRVCKSGRKLALAERIKFMPKRIDCFMLTMSKDEKRGMEKLISAG